MNIYTTSLNFKQNINKDNSKNYIKPNYKNNISFTGKTNTDLLALFNSIYANSTNTALSKNEYKRLIRMQLGFYDEKIDKNSNEVKNNRPLFEPYLNTADEELLGLCSFCAFHDWHEYINNYVNYEKCDSKHVYNYNKTRRALLTDVKIALKTLEYSLQKLDEKYGKYEGMLYRTGIVDEKLKQYYACSTDQICAISHGGIMLPGEIEYHIIDTRKGHKLYSFQEEASTFGKFINDGEQEVLLDRKSILRKLAPDECNEAQVKAKKNFLEQILKEYDIKNGTKKFEEALLNPEVYQEYLSKINYWIDEL